MINSINSINNIPSLNLTYTSPESKQKTVAILGSSASTEPMEKYLKASADITRHFVENEYNVVHGCGSHGIMGEVYNAAQKYSQKNSDGKPIHNLAIIVEPLWGDENLNDCIPIGKAKSEAERIGKFAQVADSFVIFPGSATTMQEATTLIQNNRYPKMVKLKRLFYLAKIFGMVLQNNIKRFLK